MITPIKKGQDTLEYPALLLLILILILIDYYYYDTGLDESFKVSAA